MQLRFFIVGDHVWGLLVVSGRVMLGLCWYWFLFLFLWLFFVFVFLIIFVFGFVKFLLLLLLFKFLKSWCCSLL